MSRLKFLVVLSLCLGWGSCVAAQIDMEKSPFYPPMSGSSSYPSEVSQTNKAGSAVWCNQFPVPLFMNYGMAHSAIMPDETYNFALFDQNPYQQNANGTDTPSIPGDPTGNPPIGLIPITDELIVLIALIVVYGMVLVIKRKRTE